MLFIKVNNTRSTSPAAAAMSFDSSHTVAISSPVDYVFECLSSADKFQQFLHLSPTCHSVEILHTDEVALHVRNGLSESALCDIAADRPVYENLLESHQPASSITCTRIHFQMVERVHLMFGMLTKDVVIIGAQTICQPLRLHIYESEASQGLVKIYKLRRFTAEEQQKTLVEELICGKTNRMLRRYTQASCRDAHRQHMQLYQSLVK